MVAGLGPRIAPQSVSVPAYLHAPINRNLKIGAYVGVPLSYSDGSLFGTLCAIHPEPMSDALVREQPMIELLAGMLSGILNSELQAIENARRAERASAEAETDALTGLYNRRGWDRLLAAEDVRCRRYGHPACIVAIDLDGLKRVNDSEGHAAGDRLIRRAALTIGGTIRNSDVAARVGGDEFAVLGVECDEDASQVLAGRLRKALDDAGVAASIGFARHLPAFGLEHAWQQADAAMYAAKPRSSRVATIG
jgi:diguanylate cyclase (GGDEF)-like protein